MGDWLDFILGVLAVAPPAIACASRLHGRVAQALDDLARAAHRELDLTHERDELSRALRLVRDENAHLRAEVRRLAAGPYRNTLLPPAPPGIEHDDDGGLG